MHAQNLKLKGLYADILDGQWESPLNLNEQDYLTAKEHTTPIIEQVGKPIRTLIEASEVKRNILRSMMKQFVEISKNR